MTNMEEVLSPIAAALQAEAKAQARVSESIRKASRSGVPLAAIAAGTGLTKNQVAYRGFKDEWPSMIRHGEKRSPIRLPEGVVSVTEAAKLLGVTRTTVYKRIQRGALQCHVPERGPRYVRLDAADSGS